MTAISNVHQLRRHDLVEGDVVRLRADGPLMLVAIADGDVQWRVICLWMGGVRNRRLQQSEFDARLLTLVAKGCQP